MRVTMVSYGLECVPIAAAQNDITDVALHHAQAGRHCILSFPETYHHQYLVFKAG